MTYEKQAWVDLSPAHPISAERMSHIEDGIADAGTGDSTLTVTSFAAEPDNPVGVPLTTTNGTWTGSPTFTYQWTRSGVDIPGSTTNTYIPVTGDIGQAIGVKVTGTNSGGSLTVASSNTITISTSSDTTLDPSNQLVLGDATAGTLTLFLPTAVNNDGVTLWIRKIAGENDVQYIPAFTQTIDGTAGAGVISDLFATVGIVSDGANWQRIDGAGGSGSIVSIASAGGTVAITGGTGPNVNLEVSGSATPLSVVGPKTGNYTVQGSDDVVLASNAAAGIHITLPTAVAYPQKRLSIIKSNAYTNLFGLDVETSGGQTISGQTKVSLTAQGECLTVLSDGANWQRIDGNQSIFESTIRDWWVGNGTGVSGSGRSQATAFVTFAEAASASQSGDTIHLCADITEACTLNGQNFKSHGFRINAPSPTGTCMTVNGSQSEIWDLHTFNGLTNWTGTALHLEDGNYNRFYNFTHASQFAATQTHGGIGLFAAHGEGNAFYSPYVNGCNVGFELAEEFSVNSFFSMTAVNCYQSLYFNGQYTNGGPALSGSGGCTFIRAKMTSNVTLVGSDYGVLFENNNHGGANPSGHVFFFGDFTEGQGKTHLQDGCGQNYFYRLAVAGQMDVDSSSNTFISPQGDTLNINGDNNLIENNGANPLNLVGIHNQLRGPKDAGNNGSRLLGTETIAAGNFVEQMHGYAALDFPFDVTAGDIFRAEIDATPFTLQPPVAFDATATTAFAGWEITLIFHNGSGSPGGDITFSSPYVLTGGAWTSPAAGKSKIIRFKSDGTNWIEMPTRSADY